jgi:hypothetical protein
MGLTDSSPLSQNLRLRLGGCWLSSGVYSHGLVELGNSTLNRPLDVPFLPLHPPAQSLAKLGRDSEGEVPS